MNDYYYFPSYKIVFTFQRFIFIIIICYLLLNYRNFLRGDFTRIWKQRRGRKGE